jgi:hypothetical protein
MRFLLLLLLPVFTTAQSSDILLLQKHNRTIRQFFAGNFIQFYTTEHQLISANIDSIRRDSLFLVQYDIRMVPNIFGTYAPDTTGRYQLLFSLANIGSFPANSKRINIFTNGTLLITGGSAFLLLNVINTLSSGDRLFAANNTGYLTLGATILAAGILQKLITVNSDEYRLGKKYHLKYLPVVAGK